MKAAATSESQPARQPFASAVVDPTLRWKMQQAARRLRGVTDSTLRVVEGQPDGWGPTTLGTAVRAAIIGGVLYALPGAKRWTTVALQAVVSSIAITTFLFAAHAVQRRVS